MLVTAPEHLIKPDVAPKILFLAGTIDNGTAVDWQSKMPSLIKRDNVTILNPRRADWNPDATSHDVNMQILWEQKYLEVSDVVFFNILPDSTSMITLMELGQMCQHKRMSGRGGWKTIIVCCPKEYIRFDNVFTMCAINGIPLFTDFDLAVNYLNIRLNLK